MVVDPYKQEIKVGSKVAFNHSGSVALGVVKEIKPYTRYGKTYTSIIVNHSGPGFYFILPSTSRISNPNNLVVLGG